MIKTDILKMKIILENYILKDFLPDYLCVNAYSVNDILYSAYGLKKFIW